MGARPARTGPNCSQVISEKIIPMRPWLKRSFSFLFTSLILLNQFLVPVSVLAEELAVDPTPAPSCTPEPSPEPTISSTSTGDAQAESSSSIDANSTESTLPGSIEALDCSVSGTIGCPVDEQNVAVVLANDNTSQADTGSNDVSNDEGSAVIDSGDAGAISTTINQLNTVSIIATPSAEASGSSDLNQGEGGEIAVSNAAQLETTTSSQASSGGNDASGNGYDAQILSGDSIASVSVANLVNTNTIGSDVQFLVINITQDQEGNINLLEIWKALQGNGLGSGSDSQSSGALNIELENQASVSATLQASAISGDNSANDNGGNVLILSGNSFASASLLNLINTNLIGSKFLFAVINIFREFSGDIIVPSTQSFMESGPLMSSGPNTPQSQVFIGNDALLNSSMVSASADSGNNQELNNQGSEGTVTGGAYSQATGTSFANTTITGENWFQILLNNFGLWNGSVLGWTDPNGSQTASPSASTTLGLTDPLLEIPELIGESLGENQPASSLSVANQAESSYQVSALARSGGNQANNNLGNTQIQTGISIALAHVFQMINTTIIGSNFFFPIINIFNTWNGNLTFAYPDLDIALTASTNEVSPGGELTYTVSFTNRGYEEARNGTITVELPSDVQYSGNSLGLVPEIAGQNLTFQVGSVPSGDSGSFTINVLVNPASPVQAKAGRSVLANLAEHFVPKASASSHDHQFMVTATILTTDAEKDPNNNSASVVTTVVMPEVTTETSSGEMTSSPTGTPKLDVTSSNNVNGFVYQKDTITFTVVVTNSGTATAQNAQVLQLIKSVAGQMSAKVMLPLGVIPAGTTKRLTYGLKVPPSLEPGQYLSEVVVAGISEVDGSQVVSEVSLSSFGVKALAKALIEPAIASEPFSLTEVGEVLGESVTEPISNTNRGFDSKLYVLLAALVVLVSIKILRRQYSRLHTN